MTEPDKQASEIAIQKRVYMPPAKVKLLEGQILGGDTFEARRLIQEKAWITLRKAINGLINKANTANVRNIVKDLLKENLIRGKGVFARSMIKAQTAAPIFTPVYAAVTAAINTALPVVGKLVLVRLVVNFKKSYTRDDKPVCESSLKFIAHLANQHVASILLPLQILTLLIDKPSGTSIELCTSFLKEVGQLLSEAHPQALRVVCDSLRSIAQEQKLGEGEERAYDLILDMMDVRRRKFQDYPSLTKELDVVEEGKQITHDDIQLTIHEGDDTLNPQTSLDIFHYEENYEENNRAYEAIKRRILGLDEDESDSPIGDDDEEEGSDDEQKEQKQIQISQAEIEEDTKRANEQEKVDFRRTLYLAISSSVGFEECTHKILQGGVKEGLEIEVCLMLIECCAQERTYNPFFALVGERLCNLDPVYQQAFDECFARQYENIHRLETNKLRNVAMFFAHLLHSDALPWTVL
ncbi:MAG: putative Pre-mRNA-splicing factor CWC22, partial [Streblomastix strix]